MQTSTDKPFVLTTQRLVGNFHGQLILKPECLVTWQKHTGKDVAVAERAVEEEQRQRIDLLQNYSEETCTRVHMPGEVIEASQ